MADHSLVEEQPLVAALHKANSLPREVGERYRASNLEEGLHNPVAARRNLEADRQRLLGNVHLGNASRMGQQPHAAANQPGMGETKQT